MTDFFALLDEPRRPWIEPDSLKAKFLERSSRMHPDCVRDASDLRKAEAARRYAELNAAFNCLRDPKQRLAHFLQLEAGKKPKDLQQMPDDLAEMFMEVAQLCRQTDGFLAEKARSTSPLLQVKLFERSQEWADKLNALQAKLSSRRDALTEQLKALDSEWQTRSGGDFARREILTRLEEVHRLLSFFTRWNDQIQERLVQCAL